MSLQISNELFYKTYYEESGNIFEAINNWADDANRIAYQTQGKLSKSECLDGCLTSTLPKDYKKRKRVVDAEVEYIENFIHKALSEVDDNKVKTCVIKTLDCSRNTHNLTYFYDDDLTSGQRSRVRILSRMIWYSLYPKGRR